ncbi:MAG TPA: glycosyltransferase family 2 protein [Bryobacteraceae bacterium]|nr:glycosyltransferase family 2 protein [Bryobacteraceae bacterium]
MPLSRILCLTCCLYAVYIVALYPVLLSILAKRRARPVQKGSFTPPVSVVLATHNGAPFLKDKLDSILRLDYPPERLQLIVVDDGSNDATREILAGYDRPFQVLYNEKAGKAVTLNRGISVATGEILVLTDVRQRLESQSLRLLLENFSDPAVGAVSAELQILGGQSMAEENIGAYWKYERWIRLNLSAIDSIFGATGAYYAIRRELTVPIPANTLLDDMYLPLNAFFRGFRLIVDPRARMFDYPTSLSTEFSRKVRTLAGNYQILKAYPQLLGPQNRLWLHFWSYKFGRLLLPFALLLASISSLLAGAGFAVFGMAVQVVIWTAFLLDPAIPERTLVKRLTSPIRTFVVMMAATLCAASILFVPPERLWKTTRVVRGDAAA